MRQSLFTVKYRGRERPFQQNGVNRQEPGHQVKVGLEVCARTRGDRWHQRDRIGKYESIRKNEEAEEKEETPGRNHCLWCPLNSADIYENRLQK